MKKLIKLANAIKNIWNKAVAAGVDAHNEFLKTLDEATGVCRVQEQLRAIAGCAFVDAFNYTVGEIARRRATPFFAVYEQLANEASTMLEAGHDPTDVLWHFDMMLAKKRGG